MTLIFHPVSHTQKNSDDMYFHSSKLALRPLSFQEAESTFPHQLRSFSVTGHLGHRTKSRGSTNFLSGVFFEQIWPHELCLSESQLLSLSQRFESRACTPQWWANEAADNMVFGSGGALLQKLNRDTFKCPQLSPLRSFASRELYNKKFEGNRTVYCDRPQKAIKGCNFLNLIHSWG